MKQTSFVPRSTRSGISPGGVGLLSLVLILAGMTVTIATGKSPQSSHSIPRNMTKASDQIVATNSAPTEAQSGFDGAPNDMVDATVHQADQMVFEEVEDPSGGLGPVYNSESCVSCHKSPMVGGTSQVTELRAGIVSSSGVFTNPTVLVADGTVKIPNRSLINDRATCPSGDYLNGSVQEHVPDNANVRALRASLNTLGDGYIEAIADRTIVQLAVSQCQSTHGQICGQAISVPLSEAPGQTRIARFGWKDQQASLLSFSADAYLNEMGVTSSLQPHDTTTVCKTTKDPEDHDDADGMEDIDHFTRFMRASKAPGRDENLANTADAQIGAQIFDRIGCDTCHVSSITTASAGSVINGGAYVVPDALGNKIIHPYSDFLLHNVGTGDGILQNGPAQTAMKLRTSPLWGLRLHGRFMHDGLSMTMTDAIQRHAGEATGVVHNFRSLSAQDKARLLKFLNSL